MAVRSHSRQLGKQGATLGYTRLYKHSLLCKLQVTTVNNLSNRVPEFSNSESNGGNSLWQYVQSLSPQDIAQLSKPDSNEVFQVMERSLGEMFGNLPSEHFGVNITTSRQNLGQLLASAMINGYFLRNAEQRMTFEKSLQLTEANSTDN